jgi:hypothetical protein
MRTRLYKRTRGSNQHKSIETYYGLKLGTWALIFIVLAFMTIGVTIALQAKAYAESENHGIVSPLPTFAEGLDENGLPVLTPEQTSNWYDFVRAAHKLAPIYDFPVKVILAQGALESARGTSKYATERFNYFGIGAFDSDPDQAYTYENMDQGIIEYMRFIKARFPEAYAARSNPDRMVELLKENGMGRQYATDPNYVQKLKALPEWREN